LGPKFESEVNQVAELIRHWSPETVEKLEKEGVVEIVLDSEKKVVIAREDIDIKSEVLDGFIIQQDGDIRVAIDTTLDDDLLKEGLARELINRIQHMRKENDFCVTDRIRVSFETEDDLKKAIEEKRQTIMDDVLASVLQEGLIKSAPVSEWDIDGHPIRIAIQLDKNLN
jgi:isoleucyl-tRNA synthetase